jgi:hypothetical protein
MASAWLTGLAIAIIIILIVVTIWALFVRDTQPNPPPLNNSSCVYASDCTPGQSCVNDQCSSYCIVDNDCFNQQQYGSQTCQQDEYGRKICVAKVCTDDTDCKSTEACAKSSSTSVSGLCVAIGGNDANPNIACSSTTCYGSNNVACIKPTSQNKLTTTTLPDFGPCTTNTECGSGMQCGPTTASPSVNDACFNSLFQTCPTDVCYPSNPSSVDVGYCAV